MLMHLALYLWLVMRQYVSHRASVTNGVPRYVVEPPEAPYYCITSLMASSLDDLITLMNRQLT